MSKNKDQDETPPVKPPAPPSLGGDDLMTTEEIMAYLKISRTKLWQLVNKENLPAFKIGGDYRYRKAEVDAWLEKFRLG